MKPTQPNTDLTGGALSGMMNGDSIEVMAACAVVRARLREHANVKQTATALGVTVRKLQRWLSKHPHIVAGIKLRRRATP